MRLAVFGGTSYVAQQLVTYCAAREPDARLTLFGRTPMKLRIFENYPGVEGVHRYSFGDVVPTDLAGFDACIDLSYNLDGIPSTAVRLSRQHALRVGGACAMAGVPLIFVGSVAVYGEPIIRYGWTTAPQPSRLRHPATTYARVKVAVEQSYARLVEASGLRVAIVRSGHILGPGSKLAGAFASKVLRSDPLLFEGMVAPSNATTVEGLCRSFLDVGRKGLPPGLVVGDHVDLTQVSYDALVAYFARTIGIPPNTVITHDDRGPSLRRLAVRQIKRQQTALAVTQSYLPWTEPVAVRLRPWLKVGQAQANIPRSDAGAGASLGALPSLYASDRIPHSEKLFDHPVEPISLEDALQPIAAWLDVSGFSIGSAGSPLA